MCTLSSARHSEMLQLVLEYMPFYQLISGSLRQEDFIAQATTSTGDLFSYLHIRIWYYFRRALIP